MELTKRLEKIASYVDKNSIVADVGTDHGYIPVYLAKNNIAKKVYAMDVNEGPLNKAKKHIENYNVSHIVEPILSDGLNKIDEHCIDTVIIAGMGGMLIKRILEDASHILYRINKLILSPHLDIGIVRETVHNLGFSIIEEELIEEEEKFYPIIVCMHGNEKYLNYIEYKYGKILIEKKNSNLKKYLILKKSNIESILNHLMEKNTQGSFNRINELKDELLEINEVIQCL